MNSEMEAVVSVFNTIQRSFWGGYASGGLQVWDIFICMIAVIVMAGYIFFVYRHITRNAFYNRNFNLSLIAMSLIVAAIILTIQSNIVISLGMVGSLSIVRYRTAIKDPMDLIFLFWAISIGIICGAGYALISAIVCLVVSVVLYFFAGIREPRAAMILLVNSDAHEDEKAILEVVEKYCSAHTVKARNLTRNHIDMAIEVFSDRQSELVQELIGMGQVTSASLIAHDGEVTA